MSWAIIFNSVKFGNLSMCMIVGNPTKNISKYLTCSDVLKGEDFNSLMFKPFEKHLMFMKTV